MNANYFIWHAISELGWVWWAWWAVLATDNMRNLARMGVATTRQGSVARVFAWIGHGGILIGGLSAFISEIFGLVPSLHSISVIALPLLLISNNLHYRQLAAACAKLPPAPNPQHRARNILATLVVPK